MIILCARFIKKRGNELIKRADVLANHRNELLVCGHNIQIFSCMSCMLQIHMLLFFSGTQKQNF